jgi:hypothetical protein
MKRHVPAVPALAVLLAGVLLTGCSSVVPLCPSASILSDTATLTVFRAGAPHDPSGEAYTAAIDGLSTKCTYEKGASSSSSSLDFTVRATRAPSPDGAVYHIPYYMTLSQGDRILSKKNYILNLEFPAGSAAASQDVSLDDIVVNLEPSHPPTDYQLLVGFQLTQGDLDYNRQRGRFSP